MTQQLIIWEMLTSVPLEVLKVQMAILPETGEKWKYRGPKMTKGVKFRMLLRTMLLGSFLFFYPLLPPKSKLRKKNGIVGVHCNYPLLLLFLVFFSFGGSFPFISAILWMGKMVFKSKLRWVALVGLVLSSLSLFSHFLLAEYTGESIVGGQSLITIFSWRPRFENTEVPKTVMNKPHQVFFFCLPSSYSKIWSFLWWVLWHSTAIFSWRLRFQNVDLTGALQWTEPIKRFHLSTEVLVFFYRFLPFLFSCISFLFLGLYCSVFCCWWEKRSKDGARFAFIYLVYCSCTQSLDILNWVFLIRGFTGSKENK